MLKSTILYLDEIYKYQDEKVGIKKSSVETTG